MIIVPDKEKWDSGSSKKEILLQFPDIQVGQSYLELYGDSVYAESMSLKEGLFDGNGALEVFGCVSSSFSIDIRHPNFDVDFKNTWINAFIRNVGESWVPLFKGYIYSVGVTRTENVINLQCYDALSHFADYNVYGAFLQLSDIFTFGRMMTEVMQFMDLPLADTDYPAKELTSVFLHKNLNSTEISFLDVIKSVAQLLGRFAIIDKDGCLDFREVTIWEDALPYPSNDQFPANDFYPGEYSEGNHTYIDAYKDIWFDDYFVKPIDKVTLRESESDSDTVVIGTGNNNYLVEGNMFIKCLTSTDKITVATNIYNKIKDITYLPFDARVLGRPYIEVGDSTSFYVYDYSGGSPQTRLMTFVVFNRMLKGIQWLEDTYTASGDEYQPQVKITISGDQLVEVQAELEEIREDVSTISSDVSDVSDTVDGLSSTVTTQGQDITDLQQSVTALEGLITLSTVDIGVGAPLPNGHLYLVYE